MSKKIKIGVIGCGYWGPRLIRNFGRTSHGSVIMAADISQDRLIAIKQEYPSIITTQKYTDIIYNPEVDAVAIATPVNTHYVIAKEALEAGKHVFIEKPMTSRASHAIELIEIAEKNDRILMVDHTFLFTGAVEKIKEIVDSGRLGNILYFDSIRINLGLFQHDVNVIWDLAPHDLSIMLHIIKKRPTMVSAVGSCHAGNGLENIAYITILFEDETIAHFHVNWLAPVKVRRIIIGGDRSMIVYDDMEFSEKVKVYDKGIKMENCTKERIYNTLVQYRTGDMWAPKLDQTEPLLKVCSFFLISVVNKTTPLNDGRAGIEVVKILEAASDSIKKKGQLIRVSI